MAGTSSDLSSEQNLNPFAQNTVGITQPAPTKTVVAQGVTKPMAVATTAPTIDVTEKVKIPADRYLSGPVVSNRAGVPRRGA